MKIRTGQAGALLGLTVLAFVGCGSDTPDGAGSTSVVGVAAPVTAAPVTATAPPAVDTAAPATTELTAESTAESTTESTTAATAPETAPTTTLPAPNTVAVGLADFSMTMPAELPSGPTRFEATNTGAEEHHMSIIRLEDGQSAGDILGALATDPGGAAEKADLYPGPQAVAPGATHANTVTLQPGNYLALCVIPGTDGIPHAAKGMLTEFKVTGDESDAPSAPDSPTIRLADYGFTVPDGFTGQGLVRVENTGTLSHELSIYRVADGKTYSEAAAFLTAPTPPPNAPQSTEAPPIIPSGGITAVGAGRSAGVELDLAPGTYVFVCFIPGSDHLTHMEHGMIREVVIS